jgi:hypothetical protein
VPSPALLQLFNFELFNLFPRPFFTLLHSFAPDREPSPYFSIPCALFVCLPGVPPRAFLNFARSSSQPASLPTCQPANEHGPRTTPHGPRALALTRSVCQEPAARP